MKTKYTRKTIHTLGKKIEQKYGIEAHLASMNAYRIVNKVKNPRTGAFTIEPQTLVRYNDGYDAGANESYYNYHITVGIEQFPV